jgi:hypothetical protein
LRSRNPAIGFIYAKSAEIPIGTGSSLTIQILPMRSAIAQILTILRIPISKFLDPSFISPFVTGIFDDQSLHGRGRTTDRAEICAELAARNIDLVPTDMQLGVEHHPCVDVVPFMELRVKMLELSEDELYGFCAELECGVRIWGRTPWLKRCWEFTETFFTKWGRFLDVETVELTNFWRGLRSEEPFIIKYERLEVDDGFMHL